MRRLFWLATGLGAGVTGAVLVSRWLRRQRERLAPANLGRQAGRAATDAASRVTDAMGEFRLGAAEREAEIRATLGELEAAQAAEAGR